MDRGSDSYVKDSEASQLFCKKFSYFYRWRQEKVAKIVPYGLPNWTKVARRGSGGLFSLPKRKSQKAFSQARARENTTLLPVWDLTRLTGASRFLSRSGCT
jgi:hypothetical protein